MAASMRGYASGPPSSSVAARAAVAAPASMPAFPPEAIRDSVPQDARPGGALRRSWHPPCTEGRASWVEGGIAMKRILVGVDGSEPSYNAARLAAEIALRFGARLTLAYVIPRLLLPPDAYGVTVAEVEDEHRAFAER